jgi:hypothetical protein
MTAYGHSLKTIVNSVDRIGQISKATLGLDDLVLVTTSNSLYKIRKKENNLYEVSGGWFDRKGLSPFVVTVRGCSWGGSIIKVDIVAACGLCLEFGNRLVTSPIRKITVIKFKNLN